MTGPDTFWMEHDIEPNAPRLDPADLIRINPSTSVGLLLGAVPSLNACKLISLPSRTHIVIITVRPSLSNPFMFYPPSLHLSNLIDLTQRIASL